MQYIDNDMDDLFKKAGENYPLRTDGADWDAVQARLAGSIDEGAIYQAKKFNRNYLWLLLLLLFIPLMMINYRKGPTAVAENKNFISVRPAMEIPIGPVSSSQTPVVKDNKDKRAQAEQNNDDKKSGVTGYSFYTGNDKKAIRGKGPEKSVGNALQAGIAENPGNVNTALQAVDHDPIPVDSTTSITQPKPTDSVSTKKPDPESRRQPKKIDNSKHGIYYGLIGGPDVSTIKSQQVKNVGYSVGGILGYRINKHWAAEAGAFWDKKKYYTDGKYFDKTAAHIPSSVTVYYLDGGCNMFEFPLSLRYDLTLKKNSFFVTAGITSYLMKKESYNYAEDYYGIYYEGYKSYKNSGNHLFANGQLSAGYNYNFSSKLSLRIEPYIKIPVKNIGIGKMPVTSKGIYFGIMRNIR